MTASSEKTAKADSAAEPFDRSYMSMMVDHHFVGTKMAEACTGAGVRSEVRDRAERLRSDQTREIEQLRGWLRDWYGADEKPSVPERDRAMVRKLEGMSGKELEREFLTMMIDHHEMAIERARDAVARVEHDELRELSKEMIEKQTRENAEFKRLLESQPSS
jgi:uncharacterized protein (DUF305 family)